MTGFAVSRTPRVQLCCRMFQVDIPKLIFRVGLYKSLKVTVCIFLFQYFDNDETLEKLYWIQNVFRFCQVENIFGMRTHVVSFVEDECR